jgi:hypothetical protein
VDKSSLCLLRRHLEGFIEGTIRPKKCLDSGSILIYYERNIKRIF